MNNISEIIARFPALLTTQDGLIKLALILIMIIFLLFTLILARQINSLTNLVNQVSFTPVFKLIAYGVVAATLALLLFVILV